MRVAQSVAEILSKHVVLEVEGIDRMYLNVYVPRLQIIEGVLGFMKNHLGHKVASTKLVEPITRRFVAAIEQFVRDQDIPLICFEKGERKEEVAARLRAGFSKKEAGGLCREGTREMYRLSNRETSQSEDRQELCLDREVRCSGESILLLLRGPGLRPFLFKVLLLLPL